LGYSGTAMDPKPDKNVLTWGTVAWVSGSAFIAGALGMTFLAAGSIYDYSDTVREEEMPEGVEAVVCLAGGRGRIRHASEVWFKYWERMGAAKAPVFYVAGAGAGAGANRAFIQQQIRKEVRDVLFEIDRDPKRSRDYLVVEDQSANTVENAEYFSRQARGSGWRHVLLMTSSYHMKRSRMIFEQVVGRDWDLQLETLSSHQEPFTAAGWRTELRSVRVTLDEFLKLIFYKAFWTPPKKV